MAPLRCLLVEDHLMIRQMLSDMLQRHPGVDVVESVGTVSDGLAACLTHKPDLLILDLALPDGDGLTLARALQAIQPMARVIVLSSFASTAERPPELREQIVAILDKTRAYQELIREVEALLPEGFCRRPQASDKLEMLTRREREIIALIGRGCSSRQIAAQLAISLRTVETHRRNICCKLGVSGGALIQQAVLLNQRSSSYAVSDL